MPPAERLGQAEEVVQTADTASRVSSGRHVWFFKEQDLYFTM